MNIKYLLTSFDGRIRRRTFWLGLLVLVILGILTLGMILVLSLVGPFMVSGVISIIGPIVATVILLYSTFALFAKRLHDRNKPTMPWLAIMFMPMMVSIVAQMFGIGMLRIRFGELDMEHVGKVIGDLLNLPAWVVVLWFLFELCYMPGTKGPNDFGPDPKDDDQQVPSPYLTPAVVSAPTFNTTIVPAPTLASPASVNDTEPTTKIKLLFELKELGAISAEEFEAKKAALLKTIQS